MFFFLCQYGDTPFHTAARYGHAGVIRILVSAKCGVSEQNKVQSSKIISYKINFVVVGKIFL